MTENHQITEVSNQLAALLDQGQLPSQYHELARQLSSHLRKPVNIVITGPKGSGKSTLLNMILARRVVSASIDLPVIEITKSAAECVSFEDRDGTSTWQQGLLCNAAVPATVVRARQALNSPTLQGLSYFEVALGAGEDAKSVLKWVSEWADIVLWCTEEFTTDERALWQSVPDALKDRSCLVLTKADQHIKRGTLETVAHELGTFVAEEFFGLFPIAARQALKARTENTSINASHWSSSGGQRLIETLTKLIDQGRSEAIDHAQMLIDAYERTNVATAEAKPANATEQLIQQPAETEAILEATDSSEETPTDAAAEYDRALAILEKGADELLDLATETDLESEQVISVCTETLNRLSDQLSTTNLSEAFGDIQKGQEMVLMCELEGCDDAAADAVTVLLQLKKQFRENQSSCVAAAG